MIAPHRASPIEPGGRAPAPRTLRLVQEFINTYNIERSHLGLRTDEFVSPADLRGWLAARGLLDRAARVSDADVRRARDVREALRHLALVHNQPPPSRTRPRHARPSRANPAAVATLNRLARDAHLAIRFGRGGAMRLEPDRTGVVGALGRVLAAALTAQMDGTWNRLKACRRCRWAFYDHSKNRSGRWCVMSICGNRMKARRYRTHHRASGPQRDSPREARRF